MSTILIGDLVTRKSHGGDVVFKVTDIILNCETGVRQCVLKGLHLRLLADAPIDDVEQVSSEHLRSEIIKNECVYCDGVRKALMRRCHEEDTHLMRSEGNKKYSYFDIPGRVLHIDGDEEYLRMCLKTYNQLNIEAVGKFVDENKQPEVVTDLLKEFQPDILVLTGHDALFNGHKDWRDINSYRNSRFFVQSVLNARQFAPSKDSLVIFAGACQSYFEAILNAGANFASAPSRIFIHAYDPVFIAEKVAFTPLCKIVDVSDAITASVTGIEGVGGIETWGKFRIGLPRTGHKNKK